MDYKRALEVFERHLGKSQLAGSPKELYEPIDYMLQLGGKRIRPALLLMAGAIFSDEHQKMLNAALGLELFHNFTLVHDDIMDNAPLRRGKESVHTKWSSDIAILSGDVMFVKSCQLVASGSYGKLEEVLELFHKTAILVCEGQQLDMNFEKEEEVSIAHYLGMIEKKTAILIACSLKVGAILGNARAEDSQLLYEFGKNIGIAFQLQDDILDAFAPDEKFGKQIGGDILADKKTYLLLKALELADEKTSAEIFDTMGIADPEKKVVKMLQIFNELRVKEAAEQKMQEFFQQGMQSLQKVGAPEVKKLPLQQLAESLMERSS